MLQDQVKSMAEEKESTTLAVTDRLVRMLLSIAGVDKDKMQVTGCVWGVADKL